MRTDPMVGAKGDQADLLAGPVSAEPAMLRDFFLGFVKVHILYHAAQEPVYGLHLIEELARHGYHLSPGTLYPVLHGLEKSGYLERQERLVGGKVRKYYQATPQGRQVLAEAQHKIAELVAEVLRGAGSDLPREGHGAPLRGNPVVADWQGSG